MSIQFDFVLGFLMESKREDEFCTKQNCFVKQGNDKTPSCSQTELVSKADEMKII